VSKRIQQAPHTGGVHRAPVPPEAQTHNNKAEFSSVLMIVKISARQEEPDGQCKYEPAESRNDHRAIFICADDMTPTN
jgi:hypothetical protein